MLFRDLPLATINKQQNVSVVLLGKAARGKLKDDSHLPSCPPSSSTVLTHYRRQTGVTLDLFFFLRGEC